jgi:hypothetical protein
MRKRLEPHEWVARENDMPLESKDLLDVAYERLTHLRHRSDPLPPGLD